MSRRKGVVQNLKWESNKSSGQKFTKICNDMMESSAWQALSIEAQGLYLFIKKKYTKRKDGSDNAEDIHLINKDYRVLKKCKNTIMKYLDELIDNGFIKVIEHGKYSRTPNIYAFSDEWKKHNTDDFFIHPNDKRLKK